MQHLPDSDAVMEKVEHVLEALIEELRELVGARE